MSLASVSKAMQYRDENASGIEQRLALVIGPAIVLMIALVIYVVLSGRPIGI